MRTEYDAVIAGASLAGSTTAMLLARAGARVLLVDQRPDPDAFKRICGHYIQGGAIGSLRRSGLLEAMEQAGAVRSHARLRTPFGWILAPEGSAVERSVNIRREVLDPLVRRTAAETPGVELLLGRTATGLLRDGGDVVGIELTGRDGSCTDVRARLVVGADGRDSRVAKLAEVRERRTPHGRFSYGAYYENALPEHAPDGTIWMTDPDWAAAFPTDSGLTLYACMPGKERLAEFKADPAAAVERFVAALPEPPPILDGRRVGEAFGKLDMPNVWRTPTAPGLALVGDAALATDPLWGVGCGWAFEMAELLADCVAPALRGDVSLARGLRRYRRRQARWLRPHARMIDDYAVPRRFNPGERLLFSAAARDERVAEVFNAFGTRAIGPTRMLTSAVPRALAVTAFSGRASAPAASPQTHALPL